MQYQSEKGEWAAIRRLMLSADLTTKQGRNVLFRELERREPIKPYNRMRLAEMLTRKVAADILLKIIERGFGQGERHPLLDYQRVYALWVLGRKGLALKEGKKAAETWKFSANIAIVGLYLHLYRTSGKRQRLG